MIMCDDYCNRYFFEYCSKIRCVVLKMSQHVHCTVIVSDFLRCCLRYVAVNSNVVSVRFDCFLKISVVLDYNDIKQFVSQTLSFLK